MRLLIAAIAALSALPCLAETCKYVDKDGRIIYSNVPVKNAKKVTCFAPPAPLTSDAPKESETTKPAAAARPRVDATTQRSRDEERRQILENELTAEEQQLAEAKQALSEQEAIRTGDERNYARVLERLKPYQDAVATHEQNIESIRRELANLR